MFCVYCSRAKPAHSAPGRHCHIFNLPRHVATMAPMNAFIFFSQRCWNVESSYDTYSKRFSLVYFACCISRILYSATFWFVYGFFQTIYVVIPVNKIHKMFNITPVKYYYIYMFLFVIILFWNTYKLILKSFHWIYINFGFGLLLPISTIYLKSD